MKKALILFILLFSFNSLAALMYSVGTYVPYAFTAQDDWDGETQGFALNPLVTVGTQFPAFAGQFFVPEVGFVYHRNTFDDVQKTTFFFLYNLTWRFLPATLFRYGFGTFLQRQSGDGGAVSLRNGSGTATFYKPKETITTYHTDLMVGVEQFVQPKTSVRFDLTFTGWKSDLIDNKNYLLTVNFYGGL
jgi:hypothetical protein